MMENYKTDGLITAPYTPFKENGDLDLNRIPDYVDHLVSLGIENAFVNGTTGEGMSMTIDERKQTAEAWVTAAKDRKLKIVVHVGALCLRDSKMLAKHAQEIGAHSIGALASVYHRPTSEEALVEYLAEIAAEAPSLPFFYYAINFMTNVYLNEAKCMDLAKKAIPTFKGMKHSSKEKDSIARCLMKSEGGKYEVQIGSDDQFLETLVLGARLPVMNSYVAPMFHRMIKAFDSNDMETAQKEQNRALQVCDIIKRLGVPNKAVMNLSGFAVGPTRLPVKMPTVEIQETLKQELTEIGFFDWIKEPWQ